MRITSKGQVTIPVDIRERAGLMPHTDVVFAFDGEVVTMARSEGQAGRGARLLAHMRAHPGDGTLSTDEIMALTRDLPRSMR